MEFNKQGRMVSDSMRVKIFLAASKPRRAPIAIEYQGCKITGHGSKRWIHGACSFPCSFPSIREAKAAIDRCFEMRANLPRP
jgi:hypothetical protein